VYSTAVANLRVLAFAAVCHCLVKCPFLYIAAGECIIHDERFGTVTSTVPRYGHLRSNGFDWLKVFLQKNRKKGTLITS
jgi:hypothetical protein